MNKLVCTLSCHQYYQQKFVIQHTLHQLTKSQPGLSSPLFNSQFMHLVELICKKPGIVQVLRSNTKESGQFPNQEFALQGPNLLRSSLTWGGFMESTGGGPAASPAQGCAPGNQDLSQPHKIHQWQHNCSWLAKVLKVINTARLKSQLPKSGREEVTKWSSKCTMAALALHRTAPGAAVPQPLLTLSKAGEAASKPPWPFLPHSQHHQPP